MMQTLATPYDEHQKRFLLQWGRSIAPPQAGFGIEGRRQADADQP